MQEEKYGNKPQMSWIDINKLSVDQKYQRDVSGKRSKANINVIINNFCWEKFTPITVVKIADEKYNIIDGQHRYTAAKQLGDIEKVPCWIIEKSSVEKQANTFMGINKNRVCTNPYDLYKAEIAAKDPLALQINDFCNQTGIIIPFNGYCSIPCMTIALSTIKKHLRMHNNGYLANAIANIRKAFPNKNSQLKGDILDTLVNLKIELGNKLKNEDIVKALQAFGSVDAITAKGRELKALDASLNASKSHQKVFVSKLREVRKNG